MFEECRLDILNLSDKVEGGEIDDLGSIGIKTGTGRRGNVRERVAALMNERIL